MKTLKRLISYVVVVVALSTLTSCNLGPPEVDDCYVETLQKTGTNKYCATDKDCCYCRCYMQGVKGQIFEGECICRADYPIEYDCGFSYCTSNTEKCIQDAYDNAASRCKIERW